MFCLGKYFIFFCRFVWWEEEKFVTLQRRIRDSGVCQCDCNPCGFKLIKFNTLIMARKLQQDHLNLYKKGGRLFKLFNVVEKDPELSFEIRQNDSVVIYYNKKAILTINKGKKFIPLSSGYYAGNPGPSVDITIDNTLRSETRIKKYFSQAKDIAYKHSKKAEFAVQQNISLGSRSFDNELVVVDMEWQFPQNIIPKEERIRGTRIDLVAIDPMPNQNGENDIYLVEVKHSLDATAGDSGMQDHIDKTHLLCNCPAACSALTEDIQNIVDQKCELNILKGVKPKLNYAKVPKMMFFLSYRDENELTDLQRQVAELIIPKGMEPPMVQYNNYTIQLKK